MGKCFRLKKNYTVRSPIKLLLASHYGKLGIGNIIPLFHYYLLPVHKHYKHENSKSISYLPLITKPKSWYSILEIINLENRKIKCSFLNPLSELYWFFILCVILNRIRKTAFCMHPGIGSKLINIYSKIIKEERPEKVYSV